MLRLRLVLFRSSAIEISQSVYAVLGSMWQLTQESDPFLTLDGTPLSSVGGGEIVNTADVNSRKITHRARR
ncbi:hypothetical protein F4815DRAFT_451748 [Daldinia loculata]|nr:hypothetical protein F4815DRAFT_451748 [Daldinia loculata]